MITIEKSLNIEPDYDFSLLAPPENLIFFDIETTGLNAGRASLYLIGCIYYENCEWRFVQYFAESLLDEPEMLEAFFGLLRRKKSACGNTFLLHYNGDMFDIPFVKKCVAQLRLPYDFSGIISLDLYKKIKPYKKFLGLSDCKLKTVEKFLGIDREDRFSGGELICVYEEYLRLKNLSPESCEYNDNNLALQKELLKTLLLHNEEDILNMPLLLSVFAYDDIFSRPLKLLKAEIVELSSLGFKENRKVLNLNLRLPSSCPKPLDFEIRPFTVNIEKDVLNIAAELFSGELKYFFDDYKEYYYLVHEDYAVHKSVGEFVEKSARKQACAKNCYQKKSGDFLPQPETVFSPCFYKEYKGKEMFAQYSSKMFSDETKASDYAHAVLKMIIKNPSSQERI